MLNGNIDVLELEGELTPSIELTGTINPIGPQGPKGDDGFSPIATVETITGGATITITDKEGTTTATIYDGEKGDTGADGYSPSASVTKSGDTATITITDKTGTTTASVSDGQDGAPGQDGSDGADGYSPSATVTKSGKVATITITDKTGTTTAEIRDGEDGQGSGDMLKATYDTNDNGIVDNAEKVNNHTVLSDVPANAVFTDTTYTAGTGIDITNNVISNTQTSANWGNITGTLSDQTDLQNALNAKQGTLTAGSNITISSGTISATDTTYESKTAVSGGTDVSLCTTGEKYTWNNKTDYKTYTVFISGNNIMGDFVNISKDYLNSKDFGVIITSNYNRTSDIGAQVIEGSQAIINVSGSGDTRNFILVAGNPNATNTETINGVLYGDMMDYAVLYTYTISTEAVTGLTKIERKLASPVINSQTRKTLPLGKNNTTSFTPTGDYNPATKKYVDDAIAGVSSPPEVAISTTTPTGSEVLWINPDDDVTIEGNKIEVLTGTMSVVDDNYANVTLSYPSGFNKDNCIVIGYMSTNTSGDKGWATTDFDETSAVFYYCNLDLVVKLTSNGVVVETKGHSASTSTFTCGVKVVLMKIS